MYRNTALRAAPDERRRFREAETPGAPAAVKPLAPGVRWLLLAAAVLVLLAGIQLFVFTEQTGTHFAWTIINPLAAAFLGAGYWASVAIEALAGGRRPGRTRVSPCPPCSSLPCSRWSPR